MQVYLPDDLYTEVKSRGLPASELLQKAVREALRREELLEETDKYLAERAAEIGEPTEEDHAWARALLDGLLEHPSAKAG